MGLELSAIAWVALALGAVLVGFAKTALGGVGAVSVALFAAAMPARASTGVLLGLLLCGDVVAIASYHRHAHWPTLVRLVPAVVPGLLLGAWFVAVVGDRGLRVSIGLTLLGLSVFQLWQRRHPPAKSRGLGRPTSLSSGPVGLLAGFTTMTANAGGPVMTLYLILAGLPTLEMLGTAAWFFFAVNLAKVPFSAGLGLMTWDSLMLDAVLILPMLLGAAAGRALVRRIDQQRFERWALALSGASALMLLL